MKKNQTTVTLSDFTEITLTFCKSLHYVHFEYEIMTPVDNCLPRDSFYDTRGTYETCSLVWDEDEDAVLGKITDMLCALTETRDKMDVRLFKGDYKRIHDLVYYVPYYHHSDDNMKVDQFDTGLI